MMKPSTSSKQHQTLRNLMKTGICANPPAQVSTRRWSSPGWTPSLRLLSRLRSRAPAASSGSAPAGKPAPPATPAPPRSPPASGRDASFPGQGEPAAAPAAHARSSDAHLPPERREEASARARPVEVSRKHRELERAASLFRGSVSLSRTHLPTRTPARALLGHACTATCARVFAVRQSAWVPDPLEGGAPPADRRTPTTGETGREEPHHVMRSAPEPKEKRI